MAAAVAAPFQFVQKSQRVSWDSVLSFDVEGLLDGSAVSANDLTALDDIARWGRGRGPTLVPCPDVPVALSLKPPAAVQVAPVRQQRVEFVPTTKWCLPMCNSVYPPPPSKSQPLSPLQLKPRGCL